MSLYTQRNSLPLWCFTWKKYTLVEDWYELYRDDFDDGVFDDAWTMHGLNADRTIVETAPPGYITIASANNADARWWCNTANVAPKMYMPLDALGPCRITTKLNSMDGDPGGNINDDTFAGIFIGTYPEGLGLAGSKYAYLWGRARDNSAGFAGVRLYRNCGSYVSNPAGCPNCLPHWYRINVDAAGVITFWWSDDGAVWTQYEHPVATPFSVAGYDIASSFVGLCGKNIDANENFSAQFEYFLIEVFEKRSPTEEECYAPIDTRADAVFYDGYVKSMSNLKRAVDDKTGLFQIADMNLTLQNANKYFSEKLTNSILKNQEVVMYHTWTDEPEANKSHVITLIVENHSIKGPDFLVQLKDISQKYFTKKIPEDICTSEDFPDIHPDHEGRPKPEVLGNATLDAGHEHEGAVQAVYVDTATGRFIAANRPLHNITEVFLDDGAPGAYIWYVADGNTYIHFIIPPTDEVVTFNAEGYMRAAWDSGNGYIENPAYVILFYLRFIMGMPASLIDTPAFAALAAYYEDVGEAESCYLVIQDREDAMEILRQLFFTAGAKGWINMDGAFTAERKDIDDWEIANTDYHIFEQTDLIGPSHRQWNLAEAINTITAQFGYMPWQDLYVGARSEDRDNRYESRMERDILDRRARRRRWQR